MKNDQGDRLTVGILQCGEVPQSLRGEFVDYNDMIGQSLIRADQSLICQTWRVFDGEIPDPKSCDAWITTGSRESVNDDNDWTRALYGFVTDVAQADIPFVGICYGMQMMAKALGGKVVLAEKGWGVGVASSQIYEVMPWMGESGETVNLVVSHQEQVTVLPGNARLIAGSDFCPNSIFSIGDHMLGIQGHPEFTTGYSQALMALRRGIIPAERIDEGMGSLSRSVDGTQVFRWITAFIQSRGRTSRVV